jgi:hypothetical protein
MLINKASYALCVTNIWMDLCLLSSKGGHISCFIWTIRRNDLSIRNKHQSKSDQFLVKQETVLLKNGVEKS